MTDPSPDKAASVGKRAIRGGLWIGLARFGSHGLSTLRLLIVAWLLGDNAREMIGVFAVAFLAVATAEALSQTGISQAIIQKKEDVKPYLDSAWTIQVLRGVGLSVLLFLTAPWFADFYDKPEALAPLRVLALVPLLSGFNSIGVLFFSKDLTFRKFFFMQTGAAAVELVVSAVVAFIHPSVWALVWGKVASMAYAMVVSYWLSDQSARLGLSWPRMRELSNFGFWIFLGYVVGFGLTKGGDAVVGKLFEEEALGMYDVASKLAMLPALELARVVSIVTFPAFSLLQDDRPRLQAAFLKAFFLVGIASLLATACVIALAEDFIALFMKPEWAETATLMPALAIWGASRGLGAGQSAIFNAAGRPMFATLFPAGMLLAFILGVAPAVEWGGLQGVAWLLAGIGVVAQLLRYPLVAWVVELPMVEVYMRTVIPLSATLAGLAAAHGVSLALEGVHHALRFGAILGALLAAFGGVLLLWDRLTRYEVLSLATEIVRARVRRGAR